MINNSLAKRKFYNVVWSSKRNTRLDFRLAVRKTPVRERTVQGTNVPENE